MIKCTETGLDHVFLPQSFLGADNFAVDKDHQFGPLCRQQHCGEIPGCLRFPLGGHLLHRHVARYASAMTWVLVVQLSMDVLVFFGHEAGIRFIPWILHA